MGLIYNPETGRLEEEFGGPPPPNTSEPPPATYMGEPYTPPANTTTAPPSGGNNYGGDPNYSSGGYRTGQGFNTGYQGSGGGGNQGSSWSSGGQGQGYGMAPGSPGFEATQGAYEASQAAQQAALARLGAGNFMGGGYGGAAGNAAMQGYMNPQGFGQQAIEGQRMLAAQQFAGSAANNARNIEEMAQAKGFGDSMGVIDAQARASAANTQGLNAAYQGIDWQNEQAKLQQQGIGAGMLGSFAGAESQYGIASALHGMNQQFPVIPGISQGPGGTSPYGGQGGGGYYDPYIPGGGQGSGWTTGNPYQPF